MFKHIGLFSKSIQVAKFKHKVPDLNAVYVSIKYIYSIIKIYNQQSNEKNNKRPRVKHLRIKLLHGFKISVKNKSIHNRIDINLYVAFALQARLTSVIEDA